MLTKRDMLSKFKTKSEEKPADIDFEAFGRWWEKYGRSGQGVLSTVIARKTSVMAGQMGLPGDSDTSPSCDPPTPPP